MPIAQAAPIYEQILSLFPTAVSVFFFLTFFSFIFSISYNKLQIVHSFELCAWKKNYHVFSVVKWVMDIVLEHILMYVLRLLHFLF
jgi:hypothetical protein